MEQVRPAAVTDAALGVTRQILGLARRAGRSPQLIAAPWRRGYHGFVAWTGELEVSGAPALQASGAKSPWTKLLRVSFAAIAEELGHQYTLVYRPLNRARDGRWRAIQIKLPRPNTTVRTRKGYRAPKS